MSKTLNILNLFKKQNNPFQDILSALNTDTVLITLDYLKEVRTICEAHDVQFHTYGSVFDMLRFLEDNNLVAIKETATGEYTLTGLYKYGKDNK